MSRFDTIKEKASDVAENLEARAEQLVERGKSEYHDMKADKAERRAEDLEHDPDRRDKLKP